MPHLTWPPWLPAPLVNALRASVTDYAEKKQKFLDQFKGQYDEQFSVTEINQAPKVIWMKRQFSESITTDILEDHWFALIGKMIHKILEDYAPSHCIAEDRQHSFMRVGGIKILFHGEPDLYDPLEFLLTDYKFVSANALLFGNQGYIDQLRANAWLLKKNGVKVKRVQNAYCIRYIDRVKKRQMPDVYPQTNVVLKEYPILEMEETEQVIKGKLERILQYRKTNFRKLPDCTPDERWERGSYGVYLPLKDKKRPGEWNSKAKGRFSVNEDKDAEQKAIAFAQKIEKEDNVATKIIYKKGYPTLCDYCSVIQWCDQRQKELREQSANIIEDE